MTKIRKLCPARGNGACGTISRQKSSLIHALSFQLELVCARQGKQAFHCSHLVTTLRTEPSLMRTMEMPLRLGADWRHIPVPIRLRSTLTTLDLRHFVWNIAERLGSKKDYTGEVRAIFIKRMFPNVMKDIELDSIRNFKFQPDTGSIMIDEPEKGDYHFHFE